MAEQIPVPDHRNRCGAKAVAGKLAEGVRCGGLRDACPTGTFEGALKGLV